MDTKTDAANTTKMTSVVVPVVNTAALLQDGELAKSSASQLVIDSDTMYELAGEELAAAKKALNDLEEMRLKVSKPLHDAKTANDANFKTIKAPWEAAEKKLKAAMIEYQDKQEQKRLEEQRKAEALAAEQRREAEAAALQAQQQADAALEEAANAVNPEQEAQAMQRAEALEAAANDHLMEAEIAAPATIVVPKATARGTSLRGTWGASVTDKLALIKHIAANAEQNPDLLMLLDVNDSALNKRAKALENNLNLPGVKPEFKRSIAARAA